MRGSRFQFLAVLLVGGGLGFAAASSGFNPFRASHASSAGESANPTPCPLAGGCCAAPDKAAALAAIAAHNEKVSADLQKNGKKPNILFIMGDDIGMWNIGAYHR